MSDKTKATRKAKKLSPREAKTLKQILALTRDNFSTRNAWILTDGVNVTVARQRDGSVAEGTATLPRGEFNQLIEWYLKGQSVRSGASQKGDRE